MEETTKQLLTTIAENQPKIKELGYNEGFGAGKKAEYDAFWDGYQKNGNRNDYSYAFYNWYDEPYNPKHPIVINDGAYSADGIFTWSKITDTRVPIILRKARFTINSALNLHTIRLLNVDETTGELSFPSCTSLQNITIEGIISKSASFASSPLSVESMKSVITHLKDYAGTADEYKYTVTFKATAFETLEASDEIPPSGATWTEYIDDLKWNLTLA